MKIVKIFLADIGKNKKKEKVHKNADKIRGKHGFSFFYVSVLEEMLIETFESISLLYSKIG